MTKQEIKNLVLELNSLNSPTDLKTDQQHQADRARSSEICTQLGEKYAEDVFDKYGRYAHKI